MKKAKTIFVILLLLILLMHIFSYWLIFPINSERQSLTLTRAGGWVSPQKITLKHYVNGVYVCDYVMELKVPLNYQTSHKYSLPQLTSGSVEVEVQLTDGDGVITKKYENAEKLYKYGLLIYFSNDNLDANRYVYFICGKNKICYSKQQQNYDLQSNFENADWIIFNDAPKPKFLKKKEKNVYFGYNGWKENEWLCIEKR